jgi:hypothetical protein
MHSNLTLLLLLMLLVFLLCAAFVFWSWGRFVRFADNLPGSSARPFFESAFTSTTKAGFKVAYRLSLAPKDLNLMYSIGLAQPLVQGLVAKIHNPFSEISSAIGSMKFRFGWPAETSSEQRFLIDPGLQISRFVQRSGEDVFCDIPLEELVEKLGKMNFEKGHVTLHDIHTDISNELIEENYEMLTEEDKTEIGKERSYQALEEKLTVAFLKRRLDFQKLQMKQRHETSEIIIETEPAGQMLRINWRFNAGVGGSLLGFRRTDSFFPYEGDQENNGPLVIHSMMSGEAVESLKRGTTYFYTFLLKKPNDKGEAQLYFVARFQVTTPPEEAPIDPARKKIARALERVGLGVEFHEALNDVERSLTDRVRRLGLSPEEEEKRIMDVRDIVDLQRAEFEL